MIERCSISLHEMHEKQQRNSIIRDLLCDQKQNNMPLQNFLTVNDDFLDLYRQSGAASTKEYRVFDGAVSGTLQFNEAFPEPYYGNPYDSLAVIININPGGAVASAPPLTEKYSSYAQGFPYLNGGGCLKGQKWWVSRHKWMQRLEKMYNGTTAVSPKMPFALEICPWHSKNWKGMKLTNKVKEYIQERVLEPATEAIKHSQLGFGLCVSKQVYNYLLGCGAKVEIDENVWTPTSISNWPKSTKGNNTKREYSLLSYDGAYFLCTWAPGGNHVPSHMFEPIEKFIIDDIRKIMK